MQIVLCPEEGTVWIIFFTKSVGPSVVVIISPLDGTVWPVVVLPEPVMPTLGVELINLFCHLMLMRYTF